MHDPACGFACAVRMHRNNYPRSLQGRWGAEPPLRNVFDCNTNYKLRLLPLVIDYQPKGCYSEGRKRRSRTFPKTFGVVQDVDYGNPDVDQIFSECKDLAENEGYEMFAIQVKTETVFT